MKDFKFEVYGLDPPRQAVQYAQNKLGLRFVKHGTLENSNYSSDYFDVVTMFYVLEHVLDPKGLLIEINRIMKIGGLLIIRVPHIEPIIPLARILGWHDYFQALMHLNDFSPEVMNKFLLQANFHDTKVFIGKARACTGLLERTIALLAKAISKSAYKLSIGSYCFPHSGTKTYVSWK